MSNLNTHPAKRWTTRYLVVLALVVVLLMLLQWITEGNL